MKSASEQQATKLASVIVEHQGLFTRGSAEKIQWAIQNGTQAVDLFITALENREQETEGIIKKILTPLTTIRIGGTTVNQLIADIKANKNENEVADEVSDYADSMMNDKAFVISQETGSVDLVVMKIGSDLGFTKNPRTDEFMTAEFCARWSVEYLNDYIIELCQPEDGPKLRKKWIDQPKGTAVWMAMERIPDSDGDPRVFCVERHSGGPRWLDGRWTFPVSRWCRGSAVVFRFRKIQNSVS